MKIDIRAATVENPELAGLQGKFKLLAGKWRVSAICQMITFPKVFRMKQAV